MHNLVLSPFLFLLPAIGLFLLTRVFFHLFRSTLSDNPPPRFATTARVRGPFLAPRSTESLVFALAYRLGGRLTLSDVVMETGLALADAEALVDHMVDELHVRMVVAEEGLVIYEFPEVIDRLERESR